MGAIRPTDLDQFIGQANAVNILKIAVRSAKHQERSLGHTLFTGSAGLGKTSLAMSVLPKEMGTTASFINCAAVEKPQDITSVLAKTREGAILFLDELHALIPAAREHLLTAMEDQQLNVRLDGQNGSDTQIMVVKLPSFTVIGATTRVGQLDGPLRSRFVNTLTLQPYEVTELAEIAVWQGKARGVNINVWHGAPQGEADGAGITDSAAMLIGAHAQGSARVAVNLVEASIDTLYGVHGAKAGAIITGAMVQETLNRLGYFKGMDANQLRYLQALINHGTAGLKALSGLLGETEQTIEDVIEPWLMRRGYVERTSTGRKATDAGRKAVT